MGEFSVCPFRRPLLQRRNGGALTAERRQRLLATSHEKQTEKGCNVKRLYLWRPSLKGGTTRQHLTARAAVLALLAVGAFVTSAFLGQSARAATPPTRGLSAVSPLSGGIPPKLGIPAIAPSDPRSEER